MIHQSRTWQVADVADLPTLAEKLVEHTWCACQGWKLPGGGVLLNDGFGGDSVPEYAVVSSDGVQIESLTIWGDTTKERLAELILECLTGPVYYGWKVPRAQIQTSAEHGRCSHCA